MANPSFDGLTVLTLENRRAKEMVSLVTTYGGRSLAAESLREVPLASNQAALDFAAALQRGDFDIVVFLTGVGVRVLMDVIAPTCSREQFVTALTRTKVVVRGPKPMAVMRELGVPAWVLAPEPNTWRELLMAIDAAGPEPLRRSRVAVQEYGVSSPELLAGLESRGAIVTAVPVYQWELPEDLQPLKDAVTAVAEGRVDVVVLTTGIQLAHLWEVAGGMGRRDDLLAGLGRTVVASIGPTTSDAIRRLGLAPDLEASHPKMGMLVREAAEQSAALLEAKRLPS